MSEFAQKCADLRWTDLWAERAGSTQVERFRTPGWGVGGMEVEENADRLMNRRFGTVCAVEMYSVPKT